MASSPAPSNSANPTPAAGDSVIKNPRKPSGFLANAKKNKHSFIQFAAMAGILLLSFRSLGQKYRINDLQEDTSALQDEQQSLTDRMNRTKQSLLAEAALEPSGQFASRLRVLFGDDDKSD